MIQLIAANGEISYGVNEYVIDTDTELANIPQSAEAGSTAYSVSSGSTFIKGNDGNWSVKNAGTGGGQGDSPVIELPDNLLYSYEMTEEEFWSAYSAGNLSNGLYSRIGENEMIIEQSDINLNLNSLCCPVVYNDSFWAISYEMQDTLLQFDQDGNLKQQICISELLKQAYPDNYFNPFSIDNDGSLTKNDSIAIDQNGFLYLYNAANYFFTMDTNNILNCQLTYQNLGTKIFRNVGYNWSDNINKFDVADGGIFCPHGDYEAFVSVFYYKNGQTVQYWGEPDSSDLKGAVVNYNKNQLFELRVDGKYDRRKTYYIYSFNIDGSYEILQLNTPETYSHPQYIHLIPHEHYLYVSFMIENNLYFCIVDTDNNLIIQEDLISNCNYNGILPYNYTYKTEHYAIIAYELSEFDSGITKTNLLLLKFNYADNIPYIEPFYLFNSKVNCTNGLAAQCQNNKLLFFDNLSQTTKLLNFNDWSVEELTQPISAININSIYKDDINNTFFVFSYSYPFDMNIIQINTHTGNVEIQAFNVTDKLPGITLMLGANFVHYENSIDALIFGDIVVNKKDLMPKYQIKNYMYLYEPFLVNGRTLYKSNNKFGYYKMGTDRTITSSLIHNNEILLSKAFYQ